MFVWAGNSLSTVSGTTDVQKESSKICDIKIKTIILKRGTIVLDLVVSPTGEGGQIHLNLAAIRLMPTLHFDQKAHLPYQPPHFLPQPLSSMSFPASLSSFRYSTRYYNALTTSPYQCTLLALVNLSIALSKINISP